MGGIKEEKLIYDDNNSSVNRLFFGMLDWQKSVNTFTKLGSLLEVLIIPNLDMLGT